MQTFIDQNSPRCKIAFAELPRGVVKFPPQVVDAVARERAKFAPEIFTEAYARQSLEQQTLAWFYAGLPVAYKPLPDGIEVLGVGWQETSGYWPSSAAADVKVVQP